MGANRTSKERFCGIPYSMASSPAFRTLRGNSVKVYVELLSRYGGYNNGSLHLSYREAVKLLGIGRGTVSAAFKELQEKGLIDLIAKGGCGWGWDEERKAATWRLTHVKDDRPNGGNATNEWIRYSNAQPNIQSNGKAPESHFSVLRPDHMGSKAGS